MNYGRFYCTLKKKSNSKKRLYASIWTFRTNFCSSKDKMRHNSWRAQRGLAALDLMLNHWEHIPGSLRRSWSPELGLLEAAKWFYRRRPSKRPRSGSRGAPR